MNYFSIIDVETTGFSPLKNDRIVEIGIIKIDEDGKFLGSFETLVNPQREVGPTHVHGISESMVKGAPCFPEIACDILEFIDGTYMAAHNSEFDMGFLRNEFSPFGVDISAFPGFCTLKIAREILPSLPSRSLEYLTRHFDIKNPLMHSAYSDAVAASELLLIFLKKYNYQLKYDRMKTVENVMKDNLFFTPSGKKLTRADLLKM
ncbi:MAG: 3'-5' exonuclease [Spirochaetales bacterium]|nr:3'-5' exonuclease [Spirochaetales bacterium]